jgi:DnaJ-class molecular chaperone
VIDYYKILGVRKSASKAEIRSAYRKLARTLHPDFNAGSPTATREFALLSKAYHVLIDPQERAYYDERLSAQANATASILHSNHQHARRARFASAGAGPHC